LEQCDNFGFEAGKRGLDTGVPPPDFCCLVSVVENVDVLKGENTHAFAVGA